MLPIRINFKNFQCYDDAELDFDFSSALIIGERDDNPEVSNGAGKSAIFNAIGYALYGQSQHKTADGIIKRGKDLCEVEFVFEHDDKKYRILRTRNRRFGKPECAFFEIQLDGTELSLNGDTSTETSKKIQSITRSTYETFVNSSYFKQNSISDFVYGTVATRQKIIGSVLDMDRWNRRHKLAKKRLDFCKIEVGKVEFSLSGTETVLVDLANVKNELVEASNLSLNLNLEEKRLLDEIGVLEKKVTSLTGQEAQLNDYHEVVTKYETATERKDYLARTVAGKTSEIDSLTVKISRSLESVLRLDAQVSEISTHLEIKDHIDIEYMEKEFTSKQTNLGWFKKQVSGWTPRGVCVCCEKTWEEHADKVLEFESNQEDMRSLETEVSSLGEKLEVARASVRKVKQAELEIEKYSSRKVGLQNTNEINELKKKSTENELVLFVEQLEDITQRVDSLSLRIESMQEIADSTSYEEIRSLLKAKKTRFQELLEDKNQNSYLVGGLTQKVEELTEKNTERLSSEEALKGLNKAYVVAEAVYRAFGRSGIQAIIIDNVMEELTKVVNEWLHEFCYEPTYIKFLTQKKDGKGSWKETLDIEVITPSGKSEIEALSGGESFKVAFAIRLGLSQLSARRMGGETQVLLLDEVSTSLDQQGLDLFVSIIRKIEQQIKVMVITHDEKLKDEFSHIICAKRTGSNTRLEIR